MSGKAACSLYRIKKLFTNILIPRRWQAGLRILVNSF